MEIRPTHTCFDDALEFIGNLEHHELPRFAVVHALCSADCMTDPTQPYSHAWVEQTRERGEVWIWQAGILETGDRAFYALHPDEFYAVHRVIKATRYAPKLACEIVIARRSTGPWRHEYIEAVARGDLRTYKANRRMHPLAIGKFEPRDPLRRDQHDRWINHAKL